ncbi:hypothetical protein LZ198_32235 [Myxococcus sp. K15C18031901]|uniref:hypothetical protein n=1 Tax=Myxococcus dinghuensis TaxID=2906761 RepID=UPI0020A81917|nr:hypothetical protein [Myxococcus dinghuensis]MCP3103563.1 hypothetical protein [Myxococcus dinghuensis]
MLQKLLAVACVAAAWLGVGCGGGTQDETAPDALESSEQRIIWLCEPNDRWVRTWYSNAAKTLVTGWDFCCDGVETASGSRGGYYSQQSYATCGLPEA